MLPFQKRFLVTIRSLLGLFSDLKPMKVKCILTTRLNPDYIVFFLQIRGLGRFYDNPLSSGFKNCLRLLLMVPMLPVSRFPTLC